MKISVITNRVLTPHLEFSPLASKSYVAHAEGLMAAPSDFYSLPSAVEISPDATTHWEYRLDPRYFIGGTGHLPPHTSIEVQIDDLKSRPRLFHNVDPMSALSRLQDEGIFPKFKGSTFARAIDPTLYGLETIVDDGRPQTKEAMLTFIVSRGRSTRNFSAGPVHDGAQVLVSYLSNSSAIVNVTHDANPAAPCRVRCSDGAESEGCIDCTIGKFRVRVCC